METELISSIHIALPDKATVWATLPIGVWFIAWLIVTVRNLFRPTNIDQFNWMALIAVLVLGPAYYVMLYLIGYKLVAVFGGMTIGFLVGSIWSDIKGYKGMSLKQFLTIMTGIVAGGAITVGLSAVLDIQPVQEWYHPVPSTGRYHSLPSSDW